jgi:hypothetical protein
MRRLFLTLCLTLAACDGGTDAVNRAVNNIDPLCGTSADGVDPLCTDSKPAQLEVDATIYEQQNCPTHSIYSPLIDRTFTALLDASNADKFDEWQGSYRASGDSVEAIWSHGDSHYKMFWTDNQNVAEPGSISIWERTNAPFEMGYQEEIQYQGHFMDVGVTGCVNFGIAWEAEPGKMQWNDGYDWQIQYHDDWQGIYQQAIVGLAITLGLK